MQQYLQKKSTKKIYTSVLRVCQKNIFESVWQSDFKKTHHITKQNSAQELACTGIPPYPFSLFDMFDSICRTIRPTLVYPPIPPLCVLYALIASYPSYLTYPMSSIDGNHRATAGVGMMCIVPDTYRTSGCKMLPISIITPVQPISPCFFYLSDIRCTIWRSYNIINIYLDRIQLKNLFRLRRLVSYALCPMHPSYQLETSIYLQYSICFSLEEPIHLSNLDSHLSRNCQVDPSTIHMVHA